MTVRNLSRISFEIVLDCFLTAFDNYFVSMPTDRAYYERRWKAAKVDFDHSYGMFDGERMVGFIIHAVDTRSGKLTAFNTGTGVIPEYRGKRMIRSIYEYALKDMADKGIEKSTLEVITKNDIALSLYKGIGFEKCKEYKCFNGRIELEAPIGSDLEEINEMDVDWSSLPGQEFYSWDNQRESIVEGEYRFFYVIHDQRPESFFIINPDANYLAQFDVLNEESDGWGRLFAGIKSVCSTIKVNNVDSRLKEKQEALASVGLENTIDQFEMELRIKDGNRVYHDF